MRCKQSTEHSFIHGIQIASPCHVSWDSMTGDERSRHCHSCNLNVYNISAMTTEEAEKLIVEKEGRLCLRFYRRKDGTILTQDCPKGLQALKRRWLNAVAAVAAFISVMALYVINNTRSGCVQNMAVNVNARANSITKDLIPNYRMGDVAPSVMGERIEPAEVKGNAVMQPIAGSPVMPAEFESHKVMGKIQVLSGKSNK